MKKLLLIFTILISLVACSKIKINPVKPVITEGLKTILQTKNDVQMAVVPDGDKELTLNGQTYTGELPRHTFHLEVMAS